MGQRANLVILRDGAWQLYYDHWCANRVEIDLFWGPEHAEAFITQREPQDQSAWLDEIWFEGGAIVDFDKQHLLLAGGEDILWEIPLRWATLALMRQVWSGWTIAYATEDITEFADYLGLPRSLVLVDRELRDYDVFSKPSQYTTGGEFLLTFRRNGVAGATRLFGYPRALQRGPSHLLPFAVPSPRDVLGWGDDRLFGGVHLDIDAKRLSSWWAPHFPAALERQKQAWPGWQIDWLGDDYRRHAEVSGLDFRYAEPDWLGLQKRILDSLRQHTIKAASNPALDAMAAMKASGAYQSIEMSPMTAHTRGSVITPDDMMFVIDYLESILPVPVTGP